MRSRAKKNDIEEGLGQCAAQLIGVRLFNERERNPIPIIHGCVTNANEWQFLRLDGIELGIDRNRYYINDVPKLVGIIVSILRG